MVFEKAGRVYWKSKFVISEIARADNEHAHQDAKICKARSCKPKVIYLDEDDGERFEPDIQEPVDESNVQVQQKHLQ